MDDYRSSYVQDYKLQLLDVLWIVAHFQINYEFFRIAYSKYQDHNSIPHTKKIINQL